MEAKEADSKEIVLTNGTEIQILHEKDPMAIPPGAAGAGYISESTGVFTTEEKAELHTRVAQRISSSPPRPGTRFPATQLV